MIYEIKNFTGLSDYEDRGIVGAFKFGANLSVRKAIDSLSAGQALKEEGLNAAHSSSASKSASPSLTVSASISSTPSASISASPSGSTGISDSPSFTPSSSTSKSPSNTQSSSVSLSPSPSSGLSTVFEDLVYFFVKSNDGYTYGFGNTGIIYRRDLDGVWVRVYKDSDGAIKGAAEWYDDSGHTYLFWATDTKLKRKVMPGLSNWNDVTEISNNLTAGVWHTMRECGGSLIIANGQTLALVGYDGSFTNEAVNLIPGNVAVTIVERNGRTIVGCARKSDPSRSINAAIDAEVPLAQVGNDGEIFYANMTDTIPVKRFPGGGKCNPGGVANEINQVNFFEWEQNSLSWIDKQALGNMALFGVFNADNGKNGIYSYGRKNKNKPFVLNLEYKMDVSEIGAVENVEGTTIASYRNGTAFGVRAVDANNKATGIYEGLDFKAPVKQPADITDWKYTELFLSPLPNGSTVEFWYKINKTGNFIQALTADGQAAFSTANAKKAVFRIGAEGEIFEPKVILNPVSNSTPEVHRIRTYFN
jgi:hypothetical protein